MKPKLRPLETHWVKHQGETKLLLQDPLGLTDQAILVPAPLATLLALFDGTREILSLGVAFELRTGMDITPRQIEALVGQLDDALLLVSPRFEEAQQDALRRYREAPCRLPALAGRGYPGEPADLRKLLDGYVANSGAAESTLDGVAAIVSPHIDYHRGGGTYAQVWLSAACSLREAELVIIFGTDHAGGSASLTPTRQHYATPWGVLETARDVVDQVAECLGNDCFQLELNHRREHSIELAAIWLHYVAGERTCPVVPVLCGSFEQFVSQSTAITDHAPISRAVDVLAEVAKKRRTVVVAAADMAHVGPAFGDPAPLTAANREQVAIADRSLLETIASGDAERFLDTISREGDRRRICGLPPIYMMLRVVGAAQGEVLDYQQCPADDAGGSLVSIAGMVCRR